MFITRKIIRAQRENNENFDSIRSQIEEMTKGTGKNKKVSATPDEMQKILSKVFEAGFKNGQKYQESTSFITDFYGDYDKIDEIAENLLDEDMIDEDVYNYITSLRVDDLILILSDENSDFDAAQKSENARTTFGEGDEVNEILDSVKHDFATAMENAYRIEQGEDLEDEENSVEEIPEDDIEEEDDINNEENIEEEEKEQTPSRTRSRRRNIEIDEDDDEDDEEDYEDDEDYDDEDYDD